MPSGSCLALKAILAASYLSTNLLVFVRNPCIVSPTPSGDIFTVLSPDKDLTISILPLSIFYHLLNVFLI